jgi:2-polyprenyl-6-methoxyphenol hydroxylase-like FAD-dependent oxidoreductase
VKALVIGAGIGGLAAAIALRRAGLDAEVFEQAPALAPVGAGLSLWSNALLALRRLELDAAVAAAGDEIRVACSRHQDGRSLGDTDVGAISDAAGAPTVCVHRGALQRILLGALPAGIVHTGRTCTGVVADAAGVTARFAGGGEARGDLLIGADGIHSAVRAQLLGDAPPRYAGYFAYRGIARFEHPALPPGASLLGLGRGSQVGLTRCGGGEVYWFATVNAPAGGVDGPGGRKRDLLDRFGDWCAPLADALAATDEAAILRNDIVDRPPAPRWGDGRVTLLGDAAHPTTPNLGQGACQALEDAVVLARALGDGAEPVAALRADEDARRARTAWVTRSSWRLGRMFALESRAASWARDLAMRTGVGQGSARRMLRKLLVDPIT